MKNEDMPLYFGLFTEIGIIEQLSRALFEARLPDGFLMSHFGVLNHLIRVQDGQTPLVLANAFQVPKTTMTHTLSGLEKHKLIVMTPNPMDGRSKCVWLTDEGRQFRQDAIENMGREIAHIKDFIEPEKVAAALPFLTELRIYLDKHRD